LSRKATALLAALSLVFGLSACSGVDTSDPREVVIAFFGAMEKDDKAALARLLDIVELMKNTQQDYSLQTDDKRVFTNPEDLLDDLTGDGRTKTAWFRLQRIVSKANITGQVATVEVTFVDKGASQGYRTSFGLQRNEGRWRIYSFKTHQDPSG